MKTTLKKPIKNQGNFAFKSGLKNPAGKVEVESRKVSTDEVNLSNKGYTSLDQATSDSQSFFNDISERLIKPVETMAKELMELDGTKASNGEDRDLCRSKNKAVVLGHQQKYDGEAGFRDGELDYLFATETTWNFGDIWTEKTEHAAIRNADDSLTYAKYDDGVMEQVTVGSDHIQYNRWETERSPREDDLKGSWHSIALTEKENFRSLEEAQRSNQTASLYSEGMRVADRVNRHAKGVQALEGQDADLAGSGKVILVKGDTDQGLCDSELSFSPSGEVQEMSSRSFDSPTKRDKLQSGSGDVYKLSRDEGSTLAYEFGKVSSQNSGSQFEGQKFSIDEKEGKFFLEDTSRNLASFRDH